MALHIENIGQGAHQILEPLLADEMDALEGNPQLEDLQRRLHRLTLAEYRSSWIAEERAVDLLGNRHQDARIPEQVVLHHHRRWLARFSSQKHLATQGERAELYVLRGVREVVDQGAHPQSR